VDWIEVAQRTDKWRTCVTAVTNLQCPQKPGNFLTGLQIVNGSRMNVLKWSLLKDCNRPRYEIVRKAVELM
jgi:hypothetical protein